MGAFDKMRSMAEKKGKELGRSQARIFLGLVRRNSWKEAPARDELQAVYDRLSWKMRRRKGTKTPEKELKRRIRARGTFARGWRISRVIEQPYRIRIWLEDSVTYAPAVENKSHPAENAAKTIGGQFKSKLDKYASQVTSAFQ